MGNKQIIFGVAVGVVTALSGLSISLISPSGWSLFAVGTALSVISITVKIFNKSSEVNHDEVSMYELEQLDNISNISLSSQSETRHAA